MAGPSRRIICMKAGGIICTGIASWKAEKRYSGCRLVAFSESPSDSAWLENARSQLAGRIFRVAKQFRLA
jgi:hypothetical protein